MRLPSPTIIHGKLKGKLNQSQQQKCWALLAAKNSLSKWKIPSPNWFRLMLHTWAFALALNALPIFSPYSDDYHENVHTIKQDF